MKIIITESQYNFLLENSFEKNSKLLYKMWDDGMEFNEISEDRKSTRLNSSHVSESRMPSSA